MGVCLIVWERVTPEGGVAALELEMLRDECFDVLARQFFGRLSLRDHDKAPVRLVGVFNEENKTLLSDVSFKKWIAEQDSLTLDTIVLEALYASKKNAQR